MRSLICRALNAVWQVGPEAASYGHAWPRHPKALHYPVIHGIIRQHADGVRRLTGWLQCPLRVCLSCWM